MPVFFFIRRWDGNYLQALIKEGKLFFVIVPTLWVHREHNGFTDFPKLQTWPFPFPKYLILNFIYSEKATKFCEISAVDLSYVVMVKSTVEILQNFVAFSEYMNFNKFSSANPAIYLHLIFEFSSLKYQVWWTGFFCML